MRVASAEVSVPVRATGTTRPHREADLAPAMTGRVQRIWVSEGDTVRAGQRLITLDARSQRLNASRARSSAAAARAQAEQIASDIARLEPLAERGSIPSSRVEQLKIQLRAAEAQAAAADAAADSAGANVRDAVITAPFAGTVVEVPVEVGEMANMAPGTRLVRLIDLSTIEVEVEVGEANLARIGTGDDAVARIPSLDLERNGTVSEIPLEIDASTRTGEVTVDIPNPEGAIRAGLYAEIEIAPSRTREAILVPRAAVAAGAGSAGRAFVVSGGRAVERAVETAPFDDERVEILGGLEPGEEIVAARVDRLRDGVAVTVETESAARSAAP